MCPGTEISASEQAKGNPPTPWSELPRQSVRFSTEEPAGGPCGFQSLVWPETSGARGGDSLGRVQIRSIPLNPVPRAGCPPTQHPQPLRCSPHVWPGLRQPPQCVIGHPAFLSFQAARNTAKCLFYAGASSILSVVGLCIFHSSTIILTGSGGGRDK